MRTRIIAAFPGTGKTYFYNLHPDTSLDSDSSKFSWAIDADGKKIRNPDFPQNYIAHIKENIGKYKYIFVSSHKEVREALLDNCIFFALMYPGKDQLDDYIQKYQKRGSPEAFIKLITAHWEEWISECRDCTEGCDNLSMSSEETVTNLIEYYENGCWIS